MVKLLQKPFGKFGMYELAIKNGTKLQTVRRRIWFSVTPILSLGATLNKEYYSVILCYLCESAPRKRPDFYKKDARHWGLKKFRQKRL